MSEFLASWIAELPQGAQAVLHALVVPLRAIVDPGTLLHWPFLLSALLITLTVYRVRGRVQSFFGQYFSRKVWWHASARADYLYYLINGAFFPILFAPLLAVSSAVSGLIAEGIQVSAHPHQTATPVWGMALYFVATFIAYDFGRYVGHWVQHKNPVLWEFHKVHHSAEVLTPLTSFRLHPVDLLLMSVVPGIMTGIVGGIAIVLTGGAVTAWQILGMHGGIAVYHLISNLRHTHAWISFGPVVSQYLISPAQHQIHHSAESKHFHKNIGWAFAVWDRWFGTLYVPKEEENFDYGLGDGSDSDYHGVVRMYFLPFVRALTWCVAQARK